MEYKDTELQGLNFAVLMAYQKYPHNYQAF